MHIRLRDPANGWTHFAGILLAAIGLVLLLVRASHPFSPVHVVVFAIFGSAMILLYTFSTLYHWLPLAGRALERLRRLDHIMIFVFIAATYTPVCLITLRGAWGWSILGAVWGLALAGAVMKLFWLDAPRRWSTAVYLLMGWTIVVGIWPLTHRLAAGGLVWMAAGGLCYTVGAVIYALKRPDPWPRLLGFHGIFHLCVLAGSFAHFWLMYRYV
jgi:hemolysin III